MKNKKKNNSATNYSQQDIDHLCSVLTKIISELNGISLYDTIELLLESHHLKSRSVEKEIISNFRDKLSLFDQDKINIEELLEHPFSTALFKFLKHFPLPYYDEHIHLTGSLTAEFIFPYLQQQLKGKNKKYIIKKLQQIFGDNILNIKSVEQLDHLIRLGTNDKFDRYLKILLISKLILTTKEIHQKASYSIAANLYNNFNVGFINLKFTLSRATDNNLEQLPDEQLTKLNEEEVLLGLYDGLMEYKKENPLFNFKLSPCFRKEADHFDSKKFNSKEKHINQQVDSIINILDRHPKLIPYVNEIDTVGHEREFFRKIHFAEMTKGIRKLQFKGFKIRSHHGETWKTLKRGIQAVDNAMNIWHIDTLEHGLSLGINPNYYFQKIFQRVIQLNQQGIPIDKNSSDGLELSEMDLENNPIIHKKLYEGVPLNDNEITKLTKIKFHLSSDIEQYQHDILNRMIHKQITLTALPSSNKRLTNCFPDYKDHPFSWWV